MLLARRRERLEASGSRVGIFGLLGSGNVGNDGSLDVVVRYLRAEHPDAILDFLCTGPERMQARYGVPATRLHWNHREYQTASRISALALKGVGKLIDAFRIASWVRGHDVVIVPGMGVLEATLPLRPWGTPYSLFLLCTFGDIFKTKVALVSVGADVVRQPVTRWLITAAVRRAYYVSYRDVLSRDSMRRMGLEARGERVYPDLVYSLPVPPDESGRRGAVGVGVMDYYGGNDDRRRAEQLHTAYLEKMKRFVRWLVDDGRQVRLFTGDQVDNGVVREILADLHRERSGLDPSRVIAEPVSSLTDLMRQMTTVDTVVATRFHNVLCALKLAKPTLSISYADKNDVLMADMGLAEFCQHIASLDVERLIDQLRALESRQEKIRRTMAERNLANVANLEHQFETLSALLFPGAPQAVPAIGRASAPRWTR